MTPYVKTAVGNKLFTVEWNLTLESPNVSETGNIFEAVDCELISVHATRIAQGSITKINYANSDSNFVSVDLNTADNNVLVQPPFPDARFYTVSIEDGEGTFSAALLFREL